MIKGRELISLPVLDSTNGQQLGEVKGIILDSEQEQRIIALIIEEKTIFHSAKIIPYKKILQINHDFITIATKDHIVKTTEEPTINDCFVKQENQCILGKEIYLNQGEKIGFIGDVLIIPESGIIVGYEISDGFVQDLIEGRNCIAIPHNYEFHANRIILNEDPMLMESNEINHGIKSVKTVDDMGKVLEKG